MPTMKSYPQSSHRPAPTSLSLAQATGEVEITAEPHHHLVLENDYIRVFNLEAAPHSATLVHRHRHDYVFVTLGASEVENDVVGKPPVTLKLQDGETRFVARRFRACRQEPCGHAFPQRHH